MKKTATLAAFAALTVASPAASITVLNPDFAGGVVSSTNNPASWTSDDPWDNLYVWSGDGGAPGTHLALTEPGNTTSIEQSLSANNAGLTAATYGSWTVGFDYGWRTNTQGGDAIITVSLINLLDNSVLSSQDQTIVIGATANNLYSLRGTASLTFSYDNTEPGLETSNIGLRIARTDVPSLADPAAGDKYQTTAFIDNVTVTAIPEPSATLLGGLGLLALLRRRR